MERCFIVFDLDTQCIAEAYHNKSWNNAYFDIRKILSKHRFNNIVDGIAQAREAFERRIAGLRLQMLEAGLDAEKVDEIIQNQ